MSFVSPQAVCLILKRLVACGVLHAASHQPAGFVQAAGPPSFLRQPTAGAPVTVRILAPLLILFARCAPGTVEAT